MTAEALYQARCNEPHNIDWHLPTIRKYASFCHHVTEFGVERGWSTSALLASGAKVVRSYDLQRLPEVDVLEEVALLEGIDFQFIREDTSIAWIEPTDLLFIDTEHTFEQVDNELLGNVDQVRRYLIFHDVETFPAILPAIRKHCAFHWVEREWSKGQHGLLVLERIPT